MKDPLSLILFFNNFKYTHNIQIQIKYFDYIFFLQETHDYCLQPKQTDKVKINKYTMLKFLDKCNGGN